MKNKREAQKELSRVYRHKIIIQKFATVTDSSGFQTKDWVEHKQVWSSVSNLHGREFFAAAAVQAEHTIKFTIRYIEGIDTTMRILFKSKQYNITGIDNIKHEDRLIEIKAMEVSKSD